MTVTILALVLLAVATFALSSRAPVVHASVDVPQRGFALPTWEVAGYDGPDVAQSMREIRDVGGNWVQLTPTWYQETRYSSEIFRTEKSVSDEGLEKAIATAHGLGVKVFLKPHLNLTYWGSNNIDPADHESWFRSYTEFITHYAEMAQRLGVEQFAIATELAKVTDDTPRWLAVIQAVRDRYNGPLTYAASSDWQRVSFWGALDLIGVDAYAPLSPRGTTDVGALRREAERYLGQLEALSTRFDRMILFTEVGYTSQQGTATDPSSWRISKIASQEEQAAAYQAILETFSGQTWWAGAYWWVWITPPATEPEPLDFSPKGKLAEAVIRQWWLR